MYLSMKWLSEFVDIDMPPKEFSEDLTITGQKVEDFVVLSDQIKNVVVGKILEITPHPDADKLLVCSIDIGADVPIQIVTGARNLRVGDLVPAALHKSLLPNGTKIKKGKLRGAASNGMLCSLSELMLSIDDFPDADEDGILILKMDCKPGDNIADVLGFDDTIVEFEITPNRPDCLSVIGMAREVAATYNVPLKLHNPIKPATSGSISEYLDAVKIEDADCKKYCAAVLKNVKIAPSPKWMSDRLQSAGLRPINNIVDITNYVMLEYGQPMHAFDYNHISGREIHIRKAKEGEKLVLLDKSEQTLGVTNLVIADAEKIIAAAGVMGGKFSGVEDTTDTVIFESALFDGVSVRLTSKDMQTRTESSSRYEKGLDSANCLPALKRACELAVMIGAGELVDGILEEGEQKTASHRIPLDTAWINGFIGIDISKAEMIALLAKVDIVHEDGMLIIPTFRDDIEEKADIAEEVARLFGYNNIPTTAIRGVAKGSLTDYQKFERTVLESMVATGSYEIKTYSFMSPRSYDKILLKEEDAAYDFVRISNPLGEDTSLMRTLTTPSMLEILSKNYSVRNPGANLFEIATSYHPSESGLADERDYLTIGAFGLAAGDEVYDFYTLKGSIELLLNHLHIKSFNVEPYNGGFEMHPGRSAKIMLGTDMLGYFGEVHPQVAGNYGIKARPLLACLDMALLFTHRKTGISYKTVPKFPAVGRDLALVVDASVSAGTVEKIIRDASSSLLEQILVFDVYEGEHMETGKKSIAFHLVFRGADRTLTDKDTLDEVETILRKLEENKISLRK